MVAQERNLSQAARHPCSHLFSIVTVHTLLWLIDILVQHHCRQVVIPRIYITLPCSTLTSGLLLTVALVGVRWRELLLVLKLLQVIHTHHWMSLGGHTRGDTRADGRVNGRQVGTATFGRTIGCVCVVWWVSVSVCVCVCSVRREGPITCSYKLNTPQEAGWGAASLYFQETQSGYGHTNSDDLVVTMATTSSRKEC